ncbi:hypothetical protein [Streptomyces asiaticus]
MTGEGSGRAGGGADAERAEIVEREDPVREAAQDVFDAVEPGVAHPARHRDTRDQAAANYVPTEGALDASADLADNAPGTAPAIRTTYQCFPAPQRMAGSHIRTKESFWQCSGRRSGHHHRPRMLVSNPHTQGGYMRKTRGIRQFLVAVAVAATAIVAVPTQAGAAAAACSPGPTPDPVTFAAGTVYANTPLRSGPYSGCSDYRISGYVNVSCEFAKSASNRWFYVEHPGTSRQGWVYVDNFAELYGTWDDCDGW